MTTVLTPAAGDPVAADQPLDHAPQAVGGLSSVRPYPFTG